MTAAILVVDHQRAVADAVSGRLRLEAEFSPVITAYSFGAALAALGRDPFDVVVTDIDLGADDGVELIRRIDVNYPHTAAVVAAACDDASAAFGALRAGARAFVSKAEGIHSLIDAIRGATRGETHVSPALLTSVIGGFRQPDTFRTDVEERIDRLTHREMEVLAKLVAGEDRPSIANDFFLSLDTVRTHIKNILAKLEVHSTLEAVGLAVKAGYGGG
jgi:DNA-binding NarL/FixJ family response regulator